MERPKGSPSEHENNVHACRAPGATSPSPYHRFTYSLHASWSAKADAAADILPANSMELCQHQPLCSQGLLVWHLGTGRRLQRARQGSGLRGVRAAAAAAAVFPAAVGTDAWNHTGRCAELTE